MRIGAACFPSGALPSRAFPASTAVPTSPSTLALVTLQVAPRLAGPAVFKALLRGSVRCHRLPLPARRARCSPGLPLSGASTSAIPSAPPSVQPTIRWPALGPQTNVGTPLAEGMLQPVGLSARAGCSGTSNPSVPVAVCEDLAATAAYPVHRSGRPRAGQGAENRKSRDLPGRAPQGRPVGGPHTSRTVVAAAPMQTSCHRHVLPRRPPGLGGLPEGNSQRVAGSSRPDPDGPCAASSVCLPAAVVVRCGFAVRGTSRLTRQV